MAICFEGLPKSMTPKQIKDKETTSYPDKAFDSFQDALKEYLGS